MVALILFNKSAHGDKYSKIICSRFLPAKLDFRLACDVGLHERSGGVHLRHVAQTSALRVPFLLRDVRFFVYQIQNVIKSRKERARLPQKELQ